MATTSVGGVHAVFEADTRGFDTSVKATADQLKAAAQVAETAGTAIESAGQKIDRAAAMQERAAERARRAWQREQIQQERSAAADAEAARAKELAALKADILARSLQAQGEAQEFVNQATAHGVPQFAAASGAIRLLEGGIQNNVRAGERFIATTLGLGPLLMKAFPVVGAIALGDVLIRGIGRLEEFGSAAADLAEELGEGWLGGAIDQLSGVGKQVKDIDDQIKALDHDIDNSRAMQARLVVDKVREKEGPAAAAALESSAMQGQIYRNNVLISGDRERLAIEKEMLSISGAHLYGANDPAIARDSAIRERARRAGIPEDSGAISKDMEKTRQDIVRFSQQNETLQLEINKAVRQGAAEEAAQQQKAAESSLKSSRSAEHALTQQWEREFKARQAQQLMTLKEELDFWNARAATVKKGSAEYQAAVDKANDVRIAGARQAHEKLQQIIREAAHPAGGGSDARRGPAGFMMGFGGTEGLFQSGNEALQAAQAKNSEAAAAIARSWVDAADKVAIFEGTTTPLAVALHQQAAHAEEYRLQLQALQEQLAQLRQQDALAVALGGDPALAAKEQQVRTQIALLAAKAGQSAMQDASVVRAQTVVGATIDALNRMDQAFTNTADMVSGILIQSIGNFNDTLTKMLTEPSWQRTHNWDQLGASFFTSVSKAALQQGEGRAIGWAGQHVPFLKHLGLGGAKADGSTGAPFHVIVDNSAVGSGLGSIFSGGTSSGSGASSGNGFMNFVAGLFGGGGASGISGETADSTAYDSSVDNVTIPGFAGGGAVPSNMPVLVGERGPEIFMTPTPGHIIPNHQLRGMGGTSVHIDARGSTDPAAVEASVHRAMISYLPAMQSMAVASVRDNRRRSANPWSA